MKSTRARFTLTGDDLDAVSGGMNWRAPVPPADIVGPPNIGADGQLRFTPEQEQYFQDLRRYEGGSPRAPEPPPADPGQTPPSSNTNEAPRAAGEDFEGGNGGNDPEADPGTDGWNGAPGDDLNSAPVDDLDYGGDPGGDFTADGE